MKLEKSLIKDLSNDFNPFIVEEDGKFKVIAGIYEKNIISQIEQILNSRKEKTSSAFRKSVLWTPRWSTDPIVGGSNFFKYRHIIKKLIAENPDVLFVIRPHPLMFGNFLKTGEMSELDVQEFKEYCSNTNNVYLDENKEYSNTFWNSDILITDNSGLVPEYFITSKPIIYCHSDIFVYTESFEKIRDESFGKKGLQ